MRIKRKLIAAMMTGLAVLLSAALLGGTLTVATSAAKSASTAKAKHKKKPKKKKKVVCPKGTKKKGKVCIKTKTVTKKEVVKETVVEKVTVSGPKEIVSGPKEIITKNPPEEARLTAIAEEHALEHPGLWPSEAKEAGATKAIESATEIPVAPNFSNEQLDAYASGNWVASEGGNNGDHYSSLGEITTANVSGLKPNWMIQLDGSADTSAYGGEAPPSEYNGVLYYATGAGDVFAVSVKSGKILWTHLGELVSGTIKVCCDRDSRGVTVDNGLVYVGLVNSGVEALEMATGHLKWYAEVGFESEGYAVTSAPLVYNGRVYIGPTGSEENVRGFLAAFNANTGALEWKKYNIPGPGEYGHETWPTNTSCFVCNYAWATGGSTVWNSPVVDPETGDIIYATANASSQFGADYYGQNRSGANLWTDSFLARHPITGEIAWGFQTTHHDIWDYDMSSAIEMINTQIGGKKVTGVAQGTKNAYPYYLEATKGTPMTGGTDLGIEEKSVPVSSVQQSFPTQPIPKMAAVNRLVPSGTPCPTTTPTAECKTTATVTGPNQLVEGEHKPLANEDAVKEFEEVQAGANANNQHIENGGYPCHTTNTCKEGEDVFQLWAQGLEPEVVAGQGGNSGDRQGAPAFNPKANIWYTCAAEELESMDINPITDASEGTRFTTSSAKLYGFINAYNMQTGELVWSHELAHECYGGFLTTAGELLFTVNATGQFIAYNAKTGAEVWKFGEESNLGIGCKKGAEKKENINPLNPTEKVAVGPNKKGEVVWCHDENTGTETATSPTGVSWAKINEENFKFGNPGLGAGGVAPAIAFEFEGKEDIAVYAGGGTLGGVEPGDFLWEFSLSGTGTQGPIKEGEGPAPPKELCSNYEALHAEHKQCPEGY